MPIDYRDYPSNWLTEIRPAILRRAGQNDALQQPARCEFCGAVNNSWSIRETIRTIDLKRVVLTIAHLDQDIENNNPENLAALCQTCHLNHDRPWNEIRASYTRDAKKNQLQLMPNDKPERLKKMPTKNLSHSFNVMLSPFEMECLEEMAKKHALNKAIVIRQCIRARYAMDIQGVPTCANSAACYVPHMHQRAPEPQPPRKHAP